MEAYQTHHLETSNQFLLPSKLQLKQNPTNQKKVSLFRVRSNLGNLNKAMEEALGDCSANCFTCGKDMLVVRDSEQFFHISGFTGHKASQLCTIMDQALKLTDKRDVIATFRQIALLVKSKHIILSLQMEPYGADHSYHLFSLPKGKQ
jgi:hypothetical protein